MFPSLAEIQRQIQEKHHAVVPFPIPRAKLQEAIDVYIRFLALPLEVKEPIYFKVDPENRGTEVGYKRYRRELGNTDNREYFHYHALADERFAEYATRIPELAALLDAMKGVYVEAKETLRQTLTQFEERFPGITELILPPNKIPLLFVRFLKYDRMEPGDFLAKGHYDRGTCTLAISESAPGLRMGLGDADLKPVAHEDQQALFMPGIKFPDITSPEFPPTWHDVVQQTDDGFRDDIARWAIVFFAGHENMGTITYEDAHTPKTIM